MQVFGQLSEVKDETNRVRGLCSGETRGSSWSRVQEGTPREAHVDAFGARPKRRVGGHTP